MRQTQVPCFLTCNTSQFPPSACCPIFLFECIVAALLKLCSPHTLQGGVVYGVDFGGVSNGVGTNRIECTRATPVTYRRNRKGNHA
jgi:hypothetical protein